MICPLNWDKLRNFMFSFPPDLGSYCRDFLDSRFGKFVYTVPSKSSWTICRIDKFRYPQNSSQSMQNKQFSAKSDIGYQTIWIEDQVPRFVGPDLDLYCLKRSLKNSIFLEIVRKHFHFVRELLEVTVDNL